MIHIGRNSRVALIALALLPVTSLGCGAGSKVDYWRVLTSGRDGYQRPEMVIEALELEPGLRVAEIGAGDGYWLPWLSAAVGREGRVYAVEVEADKVETLKMRVKNEGFENVEVILGRYQDPLLPDAMVDLALTSKTYHHIEERVGYFAKLRVDLAPGGRVVHLDDLPGMPFPLSWIMSGHTSDPASIEAEMTEAGYHRVRDFDFLYTQSFGVYAPIENTARGGD